MKKLMMIATMLVAALSASAQNEDLRNEVSLSYGFGSASVIGDGIGEGFVRAIFSDTENENDFIFGPISIEYFRHFNNPRLAIGGILSYSKWDTDILKRSSKEKVGECKRSFFSIMPSIKYYWINKNSFGLYSKAAAGAGFLSTKEKGQNNSSDSGTYFMFQLSLAGVEFGSAFRGFAEFGFGNQGILMAGVRYKF